MHFARIKSSVACTREARCAESDVQYGECKKHCRVPGTWQRHSQFAGWGMNDCLSMEAIPTIHESIPASCVGPSILWKGHTDACLAVPYRPVSCVADIKIDSEIVLVVLELGFP